MLYSITPKGFDLIAKHGTRFLKEEGDRPFTAEMGVLEVLNNADSIGRDSITKNEITDYVVNFLEFGHDDTLKAIRSLIKKKYVKAGIEMKDIRLIVQTEKFREKENISEHPKIYDDLFGDIN